MNYDKPILCKRLSSTVCSNSNFLKGKVELELENWLKLNSFESAEKETNSGFRWRMKKRKGEFRHFKHESPFKCVIEQGNVSVLRLLFKHSDIKDVVNHNQILFWKAASYAKLDCLKFLYEEVGVDINKQNDLGYTAIAITCLNGDVECSKYLMSMGADIGIPNNAGITPLIRACEDHQVPIARWILSVSSTLELIKRDGKNRSALSIACMTNSWECLRLLILNGALSNTTLSVKEYSLARADFFTENEPSNPLPYPVHYYEVCDWIKEMFSIKKTFLSTFLFGVSSGVNNHPLHIFSGLVELRRLVGEFVGVINSQQIFDLKRLQMELDFEMKSEKVEDFDDWEDAYDCDAANNEYEEEATDEYVEVECAEENEDDNHEENDEDDFDDDDDEGVYGEDEYEDNFD